jgi:hypothetical protein
MRRVLPTTFPSTTGEENRRQGQRQVHGLVLLQAGHCKVCIFRDRMHAIVNANSSAQLFAFLGDALDTSR